MGRDRCVNLVALMAAERLEIGLMAYDDLSQADRWRSMMIGTQTCS